MADGVGYNKVYTWELDNSDPNYVIARFKLTAGELFIHAWWYNNPGVQVLHTTDPGENRLHTVKISRSKLPYGANGGAFILFRIRMRKWFFFKNYYQVCAYGWYVPPYNKNNLIYPTDAYRYDISTSTSLHTHSVSSGSIISSQDYSCSAGTTIPRDVYLYNHTVWPETTAGYQF